MTPLTPEELEAALLEHPTWAVVDGRLTTTRTCATFVDALAFVQQVGLIAEQLNHHPDIDLRWRTVTLAVCTHDAGNQITQSDVQLATRVDALGQG